MIEKLNRVFEKLPPEHRDIMREAFTILIEEVINAVVKDNERIWQSIEKIWQTMKEGFERQEKENQKIWQNIERIWQAIEELRKDMKEGFERQEKENQRIWQNIERVWQSIEKLENTIKEGFEKQEKENEKIWQAIKEGFERQAQENEKIWQAIKEGFERQEKENQRIWQAIEKLEKTMKEGFEKQAQENERIWQAIKEGFERMNRKIEGLGARWGLMAEETFRAGLKTIIEDLGYAVENVVFFDDEGYVLLKPSRIEIDIIIKDGRKIAVEIKSSVSEGDVSAFERKVKLYEKKFNIKIDKKIILTPFASSKAIEIAKSLGIEIVEELKE